jgi:hypothetical protein
MSAGARVGPPRGGAYPASMRHPWSLAALVAPSIVGVVGVVGACASKIPDYPPPGQCDPTQGVCPKSSTAVGGVGATTGTGGAGGAGTASTGVGANTPGSPLTGTVDLITSPDFADTTMTPFPGTANIVVYPSTGGTISTPFTGGPGATFSFTSVPNGQGWMFVDVTNGAALSTLSPVGLPVPGSLTVPAIDQTMMQNITTSLPSLAATGVSALAAQIVVTITSAGVPYQGVSVTGATGGAVVVYDTGNGVYSDSSTATGLAGTVILFNSGLRGTQVLTLTDATMKSEQITVLTAQGAVTLASYAWQ